MRKDDLIMESKSNIGVIQRHGDDDYSIWYSDIPSDDPLLVAFFEKYANSGASVRGSGGEICADIAENLQI